ncbi:MAG: biopolymer transporter ExbD, partial [Neisseria sp.]|nr:biopolymer transporter ExbD [Neisseria sp.]
HSIPLQLPTASEHAKQQEQPKDPLRLSIDANGAYYLGTDTQGQRLDELGAQLQAAQAQNRDTILAIAADKEVPYDFVAKALIAAREAGVSKVGFITEETPGN